MEAGWEHVTSYADTMTDKDAYLLFFFLSFSLSLLLFVLCYFFLFLKKKSFFLFFSCYFSFSFIFLFVVEFRMNGVTRQVKRFARLVCVWGAWRGCEYATRSCCTMFTCVVSFARDVYLCWLSENSLFVFLLLCVAHVLSWIMFRPSQLPSMSVCESWSSLKDIRVWAAIDDENWIQFAQNLGDSALDNISLLSALQPADVKEAIKATQGNPIARTKLRLIYAVARMMFDLDPVDVGAPPVAASSGWESKTKAARTESGLSLKVKVSSILDQSSDREVERWSREELNLLRSRYRSVEGEDPMKSEEVTDDQLSVLGALTRGWDSAICRLWCVETIWPACSKEPQVHLTFPGPFLCIAWRCREIPGPDCFSTCEACWRVFRTPAIMCDIATPSVLDRYAARFRERVDRFSDSWHLCVLAVTRCRSELWEAEYRRQAQFHESNPEISAFVPSRPWNSVITATSNDRDFWKEELEDKVADF